MHLSWSLSQKCCSRPRNLICSKLSLSHVYVRGLHRPPSLPSLLRSLATSLFSVACLSKGLRNVSPLETKKPFRRQETISTWHTCRIPLRKEPPRSGKLAISQRWIPTSASLSLGRKWRRAMRLTYVYACVFVFKSATTCWMTGGQQ